MEHPRTRDIPRARASIQDLVERDESGLCTILAALCDAAELPRDSAGNSSRPTVIMAIDQAEELFNEESRTEASRFIKLVASTIEKSSNVLVVIAIRSDTFPQFQSNPVLAACPKETFPLDMMLPGSYRAVIEGPAQLVTPKPLQIDPQLTEALLQDVSGQDALPLLAFTLASLYEEYAANGTLTLADYNQFGRLHGVIGAAVEQALSAGAAAGALPKDKSSRLDLIRKAFIPHLARVNEAGQLRAALAIRSEIPVEAHQLVDRFAEHRLLTKDFRSSGTEGYEVIEVAHEALLREWRDLNDMLQAERAFLPGKLTWNSHSESGTTRQMIRKRVYCCSVAGSPAQRFGSKTARVISGQQKSPSSEQAYWKPSARRRRVAVKAFSLNLLRQALWFY